MQLAVRYWVTGRGQIWDQEGAVIPQNDGGNGDGEPAPSIKEENYFG
jgi:hypothetical protein